MILKAYTGEMPDSEIQAIRRQSLGASDMAAVMLGEELDVALDKLGLKEPEDLSDNLYIALGKELEGFVADQVGKQIARQYPGADIEIRSVGAIYQHGDLPFLTCSPDHWVTVNHPEFPYSGKLGTIETKTTNQYYREVWELGPPDRAHWQNLAQMEVLGPEVSYGIVGGLIFGQPHQVRHHLVEPDLEAAALIRERGSRLWGHISRGELPELENPTMQQLKAVFPISSGEMVDLPDEADALVDQYQQLKREAKAVESALEAVQARLCKMLGSAERGVIGSQVVNWKTITSKRFSSTEFRRHHDDLYESFKRESSYRKFSITDLK